MIQRRFSTGSTEEYFYIPDDSEPDITLLCQTDTSQVSTGTVHRTFNTGSVKESYVPTGTSPDKKKPRVLKCGDYLEGCQIGTGYYSARKARCHRHRSCNDCLEFRAAQNMGRILQITDHGGSVLLITVANQAIAEAIIRNLSKEDYLRLPQENGTIVMFIDSFRKDVVADFEYTVISKSKKVEKMAWKILANTPEHHKITGGLGKIRETVAGETIKGEVLQVVTSATPSEKIEAFSEAVILTPEIPTTAQEKLDAMNARTQAYYDTLREMKVEVHLTKRMQNSHLYSSKKLPYLTSTNLYDLGIDGYGRTSLRVREALERRKKRLASTVN
jgi:hypothetical protein